jgi:transcriptional regulator with XRE-family HTH domain
MLNIGEVIRKNRKQRNLTQEQMANQLGVSAPAVNKWENGISYPDIMLLAPLARLLRVDINTLLSFHEELTEMEITQFVNQLSEEAFTNGFEEAFRHAEDKIREYPNCEKLIFWTAQLMSGSLLMNGQNVTDKEPYENKINSWFEKIALSSDGELAKGAQIYLIQNLIRKDKFEEAQKMLDRIPPLGFDKRSAQIQVYEGQEDYEAAYRMLDEMLYQKITDVNTVLMHDITILCRQKAYEEALSYAQLLEKVSELFALGSYIKHTAYFSIYAEMGDKEKALDSLEAMFDEFDIMGKTKESNLYKHMKFNSDAGIENMKRMILQSFDTDASMDFIREEPRFIKLKERIINEENN